MSTRTLHIVTHHASWVHWWDGEDSPAEYFTTRDQALEAVKKAAFDPPVQCVVHDECGTVQETWFSSTPPAARR